MSRKKAVGFLPVPKAVPKTAHTKLCACVKTISEICLTIYLQTDFSLVFAFPCKFRLADYRAICCGCSSVHPFNLPVLESCVPRIVCHQLGHRTYVTPDTTTTHISPIPLRSRPPSETPIFKMATCQWLMLLIDYPTTVSVYT